VLRNVALGALLLCNTSCGLLGEEIVCESPETVLSMVGDETLTCGDAATVRDYLQFLASRSLTANQMGRLYADLRKRHGSNPTKVRAQIARSIAITTESTQKSGLARAEYRSHAVWLARMEKGPFTQQHATEWDIFQNAVAVWARSDEQELALTEMDIEGWIRFGSLCREVQGGTPLRISLANREHIYHQMSRSFDTLQRSDQIGRVGIGMFWDAITLRWQSASYERQQSWIRVAPLPPAMNATSRAYMDAVMELPSGRSAEVLHSVLGPFADR